MNFRDIWTVAKKELRSCFTDKVILMQMLLLPFAIVFGYGMLMGVMADSQTPEEGKANACVINAPDYMKEAFDKLGIDPADKSKADKLKEDIKNKKLDALMIFPEDFTMTDASPETMSDVEIWYNSESQSSLTMYNTVQTLLSAFQPKAFTVNADTSVQYDMGDENAPFRRVIAMVFPLMIFMATIMICNNLAAESIAGDKERGFLNTMLITPVKRSSIAAGKSLCIFTVVIVASISAFVGMVASLPTLIEKMKMTDHISFGALEYMQLFFISLTAAFVLASITLTISALAKDVKQATTIAPLVMMVLMIGGMLTMNDGFSEIIENLDTVNYFIPAWNSMLLMQDIIQLKYDSMSVIITCCTNIVITFLFIFIIGRLFEHEKIINN